MADRPSPGDLYAQASGDTARYRELMIEYGHLIPGKPEPLPCGWTPGYSAGTCPVTCDDDCETDCHALHRPRWTQINLARDCREQDCPARSEDEPLRQDPDPCPGGCGGLTDDPVRRALYPLLDQLDHTRGDRDARPDRHRPLRHPRTRNHRHRRRNRPRRNQSRLHDPGHTPRPMGMGQRKPGPMSRRVAPARRLLNVACDAAGEKTRCGQGLADEGELWQDIPPDVDVPDCPACCGREEQGTLL